MQRKIQPNRIINGDCIEVMHQMPAGSVDFILTDPPYLVGYKSRDGRAVPNDDNDKWLRPAFAEMYRVLAPDSFCVSFYGWHQVDKFMAAWREAGFYPVGHFTFPKEYASNTTGFCEYSHENAYLLAKGHSPKPKHRIADVIPWVYTGNRFHPTEKPIEILKPLVEAFSQPGSLVLDAFCGSASTCVTARLLGRRYLGIELEPTYAETAQRRMETLEQHYRQLSQGAVPRRQSPQEILLLNCEPKEDTSTTFHQPARSVWDIRQAGYTSVRVSFKEKMEQMLCECGMTQEQASTVVKLAMKAPGREGISHLWGKDVKMYAPMMQEALWRVVRRCAVDWIKLHCPNAPFRQNFEEHAKGMEIA